MFVGSQVRAGRSLLNWSRERLAAESGLATKTVQRIEEAAGIPEIMVKTLIAVEDTFLRHGVRLANGGAVREKLEAVS